MGGGLNLNLLKVADSTPSLRRTALETAKRAIDLARRYMRLIDDHLEFGEQERSPEGDGYFADKVDIPNSRASELVEKYEELLSKEGAQLKTS